MKITEVLVHPLALPFERIKWTAHEPFARAELTLVEIRTNVGIVGVGEIAIGPQAQTVRMVELLAPVITGMDPLAIDDVWSKLLSITTPRPGGLGGWDGLPPPIARNLRPQFMAAMAGIDIALWDIAGKAAGKPVFRLLGGTATDVFTYGVGGFYEEGRGLAELAAEFAGYVADGFRAVKLKAGALSLEDEVRRVQAVRDAIGPDVLLMIDLNAPYDVDTCVRYAKMVECYDIFWLEEPLHWYFQPADYVQLARRIAQPIAHGEREWHRWTVRDFIDCGAIKFVQFDCTRYAGFSEALRIGRYAAEKGVSVSPHSAPHVQAHLSSALGDASFCAETVGSDSLHPIHNRIYSGGTYFRDGRLHLTEAPGFGYAVDWKAVAALRSTS
jgi:L-alanine-DL-glutamate epimerase-like enolase superfamily enzyme